MISFCIFSVISYKLSVHGDPVQLIFVVGKYCCSCSI